MTAADAESPPPPPHRSRWFVLGYGAAQTGAFICFIPLLTLLLPQMAGTIGGADPALLLSIAAMLGGLTAAGANFLFGALSDRTTSRFGRRRPWVFGGFLLVAGSLVALAASRTPFQLVLAVVAFQIAVNALYAPLTALVPDLVPDSQKGLISAWAGAALPVANLFTAVLASRLSGATNLQFLAVGITAGILILPFAMRLREPPRQYSRSRIQFSLAALSDGWFRRLFVSRLLAEGAVAINTLFLLVWLNSLLAGAPFGPEVPGRRFGLLLVVATLAATAFGFAAGHLSDRVGARRLFVAAGAAGMAASLGLMVGWQTWHGLLAAQLLFGASHGVHATTVAALTAESVPDRTRAGRDLGVMNLAVALPQSLAPAAAAVVLAGGLPLSVVFALAGVAALASGATLLRPRC